MGEDQHWYVQVKGTAQNIGWEEYQTLLTLVSSGSLHVSIREDGNHPQPSVCGLMCGAKSPVAPASSFFLSGVVSVLTDALTFSSPCVLGETAPGDHPQPLR